MAFVDDTFTATDGTSVKSRAGEIGATWNHHISSGSADFTITNNRAWCSATGIVYASGEPESPDYTVTAQYRVLTVGAGGISIIGRLNTLNFTGYLFRLGTGGNWELQRALNSNTSTIDSAAGDITPGDLYEVELVLEGATQRAYVNGDLVCEAADDQIADAGRVGIRDFAVTSATTGKHLERITAAHAAPPDAPRPSRVFVLGSPHNIGPLRVGRR